MRLNRVSLFAALAIVSVASNLMALQPGQSVTFGSVTLQANTPRLFGPGSVGAGGSNLALTVTVPNADAVNPATQITFHLARPDPGFLTKLALPGAYVLPARTPARVQRTVPATGPYRIASYSAKMNGKRLRSTRSSRPPE